MILGDVFATIAVILFSGLAAWAGGLISAILFPQRTERASLDFENRPWATFLIGLGLLAVFGFFATLLFLPAATRGLGAFCYAGMLGVAVFGSGGLFRLVARRVSDHGGATSDYQAMAKAGLLVIAAELLPVFGWFLLLPYVLVASFGAGCRALVKGRIRTTTEAPPVVEAQ